MLAGAIHIFLIVTLGLVAALLPTGIYFYFAIVADDKRRQRDRHTAMHIRLHGKGLEPSP